MKKFPIEITFKAKAYEEGENIIVEIPDLNNFDFVEVGLE